VDNGQPVGNALLSGRLQAGNRMKFLVLMAALCFVAFGAFLFVEGLAIDMGFAYGEAEELGGLVAVLVVAVPLFVIYRLYKKS